MSALKKLASQTAIYGLSHILGRFANYLLVPLHTYIFAPDQFGIINLLYAFAGFFNVLLTYGMETAFFRFMQKSDQAEKVYSTGFFSVLVSSLLFAALCIPFSGSIAQLIRLSDHPEYVSCFLMILSLDALSAIPFAYLRHQNKPLRFALIKNTNIFLNILLNLYFLLLCPYALSHWGFSLPFYSPGIGIGYIFIANLVASLITLPLLSREILAIRFSLFDRQIWKQMLRYALPIMVIGFAGMINETLDRAMITYYYPDAEVGRVLNGIYGANYKLSIFMTLFIQAFRYAAEPFFFAHAKTTDKRTVYAEVMNYFVLVCLFLFLLVTLFIDGFKLFIGPQFREGLKIVPVLLMANMFLGIYYNLSIWYKLSDHTNKGAIVSLIGAAITIALNLWWIPLFGYYGCAWATFCCYFSMMMISYFMGQKYYPVPYRGGRLVLYTGVALLLFFFSGLIHKLTDNISFIYGLNALLLVGFVAFAWLCERKNKALISRS